MAGPAVKQPPLVLDLETVTPGSTVPAPVAPAASPARTRAPRAVSPFDRFMNDPAVDVDKLERLMQMHERANARTAEEQFNAAMSAAQAEMRAISADCENKQTHSRYASYAQLDAALRPIYTKHGFGVSFDTGDAPKDEHVRVLAYVTHSGGHARTYRVDMPADGKGAKGGDVMTKTHATGAAMSYGMRYLLKMIWNVAVGEDDRDGNVIRDRDIRADAPPPSGYDTWRDDMQAAADEGTPALMAAFNQSKKEYRKILTTSGEWEQLKAIAAKKTAGR